MIIMMETYSFPVINHDNINENFLIIPPYNHNNNENFSTWTTQGVYKVIQDNNDNMCYNTRLQKKKV